MVERSGGKTRLPNTFALAFSHAARVILFFRRCRSGVAYNWTRADHQGLPLVHAYNDVRIVTAGQSVQSES